MKPGAKQQPSKLERKFALVWRAINGPKLQLEHRFHPTRKWRFDAAHLESKVAIELEGGIWSGGAHTRGAHYQSDCEKYNAAALLGWRVFRLTAFMITVPTCEEIKRFVENAGTHAPATKNL